MRLIAIASAAIMALGGEAMAQAPEIIAGQTVAGVLRDVDFLPNDEVGDCYRFTVRVQSEVTVLMLSPNLDTYLFLFGNDACQGEALYEDDDSGGDLNARVLEQMPAGAYSIGASALSEVISDDYTLMLTVEPERDAAPGAPVDPVPGPARTLPSLSAIMAARGTPPAPPAPPPSPSSSPSLSDMTRELQALLDTPIPASAPTQSPTGPQRPYLRTDDAMIAFLSERSPQRNGRPFICWNLPGSARLETVLAAEFPARLEVFDGADCPGQPVFTGVMAASDVGYVAEVDTSASRPRSVGVSSASGELGSISMSAKPSTGSGAVSGAPLRPRESMGSLSSPLPPAPVLGAAAYTSDNSTCRGVYDALALYRGDGSLYSPVLSIVSSDEYLRRVRLAPAGTEAFAEFNETIASANFFGALSTAVMAPGDNDTAIHALLVVEACDRRFGFTPVTTPPE